MINAFLLIWGSEAARFRATPWFKAKSPNSRTVGNPDNGDELATRVLRSRIDRRRPCVTEDRTLLSNNLFMAKLEYSDFYKFIASTGIALVAVAVAGPWLVLRESFDLTIDTSRLKTLTPIAQAAVTRRQEMATTLLSFFWVSPVLFVVGLLVGIWGLTKWHQRQQVRDRGEDAATKKAETELKAMTAPEIEAKAIRELESNEGDPVQEQVVVEKTAHASAIDDYLNAEKALFTRMRECLGPEVTIETNKRVGNVEYDAIVQRGTEEPVILEVKYIRKGFNSGFLAESVNSLTARTALFASKFSKRPRALLIIILASQNSVFVEKLGSLRNRLITERPQLESIGMYWVTSADISSLTCHRVRQWLQM